MDEKRDQARESGSAWARSPSREAAAHSRRRRGSASRGNVNGRAEAPDDLEEQRKDVIAALRGLGVRAERARSVAEHCMTVPAATLEERLRFARAVATSAELLARGLS